MLAATRAVGGDTGAARAALAAAGCCAAALGTFAAEAPRQGQLQVEQSPAGVVVRAGDRKILQYRAVATPMKPYVQELLTPGGVQILRDSPHDHKHHHGLMFAVGVDGVDFWSENPACGRQVPRRQTETHSSGSSSSAQAAFSQLLDWTSPGGVKLLDQQDGNLHETLALRGSGRLGSGT